MFLRDLVQWQCPVADRREKPRACGEGPVSAQKSKDLFTLKRGAIISIFDTKTRLDDQPLYDKYD